MSCPAAAAREEAGGQDHETQRPPLCAWEDSNPSCAGAGELDRSVAIPVDAKTASRNRSMGNTRGNTSARGNHPFSRGTVLAGLLNGPAWIRTRDQRIMSPSC